MQTFYLLCALNFIYCAIYQFLFGPSLGASRKLLSCFRMKR